MKTKDTLNRDDETRLETETNAESNKETTNVEEPQPKQTGKFKAGSAAMAAGGAVAGAGIASVIMGFTIPEESIANPGTISPAISSANVADFSGNEVPVAEGITDDMSFSEAFAAARQQCGAGGVFPWKGGMYGTYYGNEWDALPQDYKETFSSYSYKLPEDYYADAEQPEPVIADTETEAEPLVADATAEDEQPEIATEEEITIASEEVVFADDTVDMDTDVEILASEMTGIDNEEVVVTVIDGEDVVFVDMDTETTNEDPGIGIEPEVDPVIYEINEAGIDITDMADDDKADYLSDIGMPDYLNDAPIDDYTV